jgi:heat shock protein HslJ
MWMSSSRLGLGVLLVMAGVGVSGCLGSGDDAGSSNPEALLNRTFVATSITEDGEARPLVPDTALMLTIKSGEREELSWNAGCNSFGAEAEISEAQLLVDRIGGTLMGCPGTLGRQEALITGFFEGDPEWELNDDELTLTSGDTTIELVAAPQPSAKRLEAVRRSPRGLGREPPSDREVALAERIMAANAFLGRIADAAGGYTLADIGLINTAGPDRILGLIVDLRLERPVDGIYELPVTCHGVAGPPFALPPTPYRLTRVSRLIVDVTFADRRIASITPLNGHARPEPGAAYLSVPSTCERRAARGVGY